MNHGPIRRIAVDNCPGPEDGRNVRCGADVLRVAVGEEQTSETIHAARAEIRTHDLVKFALRTAIEQPIGATIAEMNGRARAEIERGDFNLRTAGQMRCAKIEMPRR